MNTVLRRTPLRVKLVAAVLVLMATALTGIGVASAVALRHYLLGRADAELTNVSDTLFIVDRTAVPFEVTLIPSEYLFLLLDPTAQKPTWTVYNYAHRDASVWPIRPTDLDEIRQRLGTPYTATSPNGDVHWRMLEVARPDGLIQLTAIDLSDLESSVERLIVINLIGGIALLIVLASVGAALVRKSLQPLVEIEATAAAIAAGDLTRRIPDPEPDADAPRTEVGRLARSLNAMLTQIEAAFTARAGSETAARAAEAAARDAAEVAVASETRARRSEEKMRQFVADASHELRTPLTTIRGFAELYRQGAATDPTDVAKLLRRIEDEAARMGLLVEDMLLLARLDQERPLVLSPVELRVIAADAISGARAVAPDREIHIDVAQQSGPLVVSGDDHRLRQVVGNLMSNALTHTPPGTPIEVGLRADGEQGILEVVDHGPGLDVAHSERVFERFYRVDAARSRKMRGADGQPLHDGERSGNGLGLAIVAALVAAHGGSVELDTSAGGGATFRIRLPLFHAAVDDSELVNS